jgi:hypothetical protein
LLGWGWGQMPRGRAAGAPPGRGWRAIANAAQRGGSQAGGGQGRGRRRTGRVQCAPRRGTGPSLASSLQRLFQLAGAWGTAKGRGAGQRSWVKWPVGTDLGVGHTVEGEWVRREGCQSVTDPAYTQARGAGCLLARAQAHTPEPRACASRPGPPGRHARGPRPHPAASCGRTRPSRARRPHTPWRAPAHAACLQGRPCSRAGSGQAQCRTRWPACGGRAGAAGGRGPAGPGAHALRMSHAYAWRCKRACRAPVTLWVGPRGGRSWAVGMRASWSGAPRRARTWAQPAVVGAGAGGAHQVAHRCVGRKAAGNADHGIKREVLWVDKGQGGWAGGRAPECEGGGGQGRVASRGRASQRR